MLVYVLNKNGQPLMPTNRCCKVKHLLNKGLAKIVKRCPFTIQLLYDNNNYTQPISLGIDAGSKTIGVSATTETKELYAAEVELRNDIVDLISTKREFRRTRRNRKTRYRAPRFNNRKNKKDGWLAPSVQHKIDTHIKVVDDVCKILPITKITIEVASFDIQKIKNPDIQGVEYQQCEQLDFWNVREYILFRDNHTCQCCKGKSKDVRLNVHHIESRKTGGDAPNNLITLCETCHMAYHQGKIELPKRIKRGMVFRNAVFMGVMRWTFFNQLQCKYGDVVSMTFGYITKNARIENNLSKTHYVDARCISGNPNAMPLGYYYYQKKVRNHNRSLHKSTILKGGIRKSNQAPKYVFGYQLFDKVLYNGVECYIFGRRSSGYFDLRLLDGTKIAPVVSYTRLKLIEKRKTMLTERRMQGSMHNAIPPRLTTRLKSGYPCSDLMKQLIIARKDLEMSPGKLAAQVSHASMAFLTSKLRDPKYVQPITKGVMATWKDTPQPDWQEIVAYEYDYVFDKETYEQWICGIFTKVVCEAKNRNHLLKVIDVANGLGLVEGTDYFIIKDRCLTELTPEEIDEDGIGRTITCIGFKPLPDDIARQLSKKYQLLK